MPWSFFFPIKNLCDFPMKSWDISPWFGMTPEGKSINYPIFLFHDYPIGYPYRNSKIIPLIIHIEIP